MGIALYEQFGFEREGTHRRYAFRNGEYVDAYSMARIRPQAAWCAAQRSSIWGMLPPPSPDYVTFVS